MHDLFKRYSVELALMTTVVLWAAAFPGIRVGLIDFSPGALALFRYLIASVVMLIVYLHLPDRRARTLSDIIPICLVGFLGIGVYNLALNYGEVTVPASTASFLISQHPVVIILLAKYFLQEKISLLSMTGILISVIGVSVIGYNSMESFSWSLGLFAILLSTVVAGSFAILQKPLLKKVSGLECTCLALWGGTLFLMPYFPALIHDLPLSRAPSVLAVIFLGIFPAAVAYSTWAYALKHATASKAGSFLYSMPLIASLIGWIVLGEVPSSAVFFGGLIALAGAMIVNKGIVQIPQPAD